MDFNVDVDVDEKDEEKGKSRKEMEASLSILLNVEKKPKMLIRMTQKYDMVIDTQYDMVMRSLSVF